MMLRQRLPRQKNEDHLNFIRSLPCVCCGNDIQTEAAHLRVGNRLYGKLPTGKQEKPHDYWTLPLCGECHREQHQLDELTFWHGFSINPFDLALRLFASSGNYELAHEIIEKVRLP